MNLPLTAGIYACILIAALAIIASTKFQRSKPVFKFRPVTDEFAKAVALLHQARFEVGADLRKRIHEFLTGHAE